MENFTKVQQDTMQWMIGDWEIEFEEDGKNHKIKIFISSPPLDSRGRLIRTIDGKKVENKEFNVPHKWIGGRADNGSYFIKYSDQAILQFGEVNKNSPDKSIWREYKRVKA